MSRFFSTKLYKFKIGDCYIKKIEKGKFACLQGKYAIIICSGFRFKYYTPKGIPRYKPNVYVKITDKCPKTKEDIDNAEFIISCLTHYSERFFPYDARFSDEELERIRSKVKLPTTDSHGFLLEYQYKATQYEKNFFDDCSYMYYPEFKRPENEFFHWQTNEECHFQYLLFMEEKDVFYDTLGYNYYYNNLRKNWVYKIPGEEFIKYKESFRLAILAFWDIYREVLAEPDEIEEERFRTEIQ